MMQQNGSAAIARLGGGPKELNGPLRNKRDVWSDIMRNAQRRQA
jgi:hypothetical protein